MKKKTILSVILAASLLLGTGCGATNNENNTDTEKLSVVTTIFPPYDFTRQIAGELADVRMLLAPGGESHNFEPTPEEIIAIEKADLFVYVGGESDKWVDKILGSVKNPPKTVVLLDCVKTVEEEIVEGMEEESEEHSHDEGEENDHAEGKGIEYDEHVWTAPENAILISEKISEALITLDNDNREVYSNNLESYVKELSALHKDFADYLAKVDNRVMVFGDRFPFRYFADAYDIDYYAAFPGCAAESEPSAKTVAFLTDKVMSEGLSTVFYIEFSSKKIAETIAAETGAKTALFHSCHTVSKEDIASNATYISIMRENLETLKTAFGG